MGDQNKGKHMMRYNGTGDSLVEFRGLDWLEKYIFTNDVWKNRESVLDVGCGNGRVNKLYEEYFDKIVCVDPYSKIEKWGQTPVEEFRVKFEDFKYKGKFDIIVFIFSFYIFFGKHIQVIEKCLNLLKEDGAIVIIDGEGWANEKLKREKSFNLITICNKFDLDLEITVKNNEYSKAFKYIFAILRRSTK